MPDFYDSSALLSQRDSRGELPDIYMCVGNRSAGKTFNFSRYLLRRYLKTGEPFGILTRYSMDVKTRATSFASDVMQIDRQMKGHSLSVGKLGRFCATIYMDDSPEPCGYSLALNDSEKVRQNSSLLQKISVLYFDEFQPETGDYVPRELERFQSLHTSIARGGGSHVRRVPVIMSSNAVSKINPYFVAFGIHKMPVGRSRFLHGAGWVLEQTYNAGAAEEQAAQGFAAAFAGSAYQSFSRDNQYLLDDSVFIGRVPIDGRQIAVLVSDTGEYGLWQLTDGNYYISPKHDKVAGMRIAVTRGAQGAEVYSATAFLTTRMREAYDLSRVRFADPDCYAAFMSMFDMSFLR